MQENMNINPNYLNIGERIRKIRKSLHMNRDQFSEKINISEVFLGQIERGERSLSLNTLNKIILFTGASANYILYGETEENSKIEKITKLLLDCTDTQLDYIYELIFLSKKYGNKNT